MEQIEKKYDRIYKKNIIEEAPFLQTYTFGWLSFLLLIVSFVTMSFVGVWQKSVPGLWNSIFMIFCIAFLPGLACWIIIRLFPPKDRSIGVVYRPKGRDYTNILFQVGVCLIFGILNFFLLHVIFHQSIFTFTLENKIFAICNSTWEEFFFCGIQIAFMRFATGGARIILGVGIRMLFFCIFHIVVYGNFAVALFSMLFMGLIYGVALVIWKRNDVSMGTHLLLNLLAS